MRTELKLRTYLLREDEVNHRNQQQEEEETNARWDNNYWAQICIKTVIETRSPVL